MAKRRKNIKQLLDDLNNPDQMISHAAAYELGSLTPEDVCEADALARGLFDADSRVRFWAATAIGRIGPDAHRLIPALAQLFNDPFLPNRQIAIVAVMKMGNYAQSVVPQFIKMLETNPDVYVRRRIAEHFYKLGESALPALPAIANALHDSDREVRINAAVALKMLGPLAITVLGAVQEAHKFEKDAALRNQLEAAIDTINRTSPL